jgi:hypothetical protein
MPILLKEILEGSTKWGSQTVTIKPVKKKGLGQKIVGVYSLIEWLNKMVIDPICAKMPDIDDEGVGFDVLNSQVPSDQDWGDMFVEIGQFPDVWRPRVLGGLDHFLKAAGVDTGTWTVEGKAYQDDKLRVRIPVIGIPQKEYEKDIPKLYYSCALLEKIKMNIGLNDAFDVEGNSFTLSIPSGVLFNQLAAYKEAWQKGLAKSPKVLEIGFAIKGLQSLAEWAIKHHYPQIEAY